MKAKTTLSDQTPAIIEAFNRWNDDAINNPERFQSITEIVRKRLAERITGEEPSYGRDAMETLFAYLESVEQDRLVSVKKAA
jgi:hypothetical protein